MIIDSRRYNGSCACGRTHEMETEFCVIESDCLKSIETYLKQYGLQGYCVAVYDENTYQATADRHPRVDEEVILPAENLHANEHGVDLLLERLPEKTEIILAIGSGTVHDISRYCAYSKNLSFVSCPTAASVDGFCSSVAAMTWNGCKKTLTAVSPKIVVADLDIIKNAPIRLARSGFGDMIGKYISLTDWKIGNLLTGEFYCDTIAGLMREATENVLSSSKGIACGDADAYEKLMYGLLMSGLAMQMMGNSRPASGAEHHISHFIEMEPVNLDIHSDALHGEKVGVGTLLVLKAYQQMASGSDMTFKDYETFSKDSIEDIFGSEMAKSILEENQNDAAAKVTGKALKENWYGILQELSQLPDLQEMKALYKSIGVIAALPEIGVSEELEEILLKNSPMVRNRLTLMRIRKCIEMNE